MQTVRLSKNYAHLLDNLQAYAPDYFVSLYMQFIEGKNRNQSILFPQSLDQLVGADNEVRIIDLFVESIKLEDFHFMINLQKKVAQPIIPGIS